MRKRPGRVRLLATLAVGMLSISFGSIFVKWAQEAPSLTIAFYRMAGASLALTPFYWLRRGQNRNRESAACKTTRRRRYGLRFLAGLTLALHFAFWVSSLRFTSVAVSTLLVTTSPVLVAVIAYLVLGERTSLAGFGGIFLSFAGATLLLWGDLTVRGWRGPVLALGGAVMIALYWVIGRDLRRDRGLLGYVFPVYVIASGILALMVVAASLPVRGFSGLTFLAMLLAGVVPQSLGHTAYNWALGYLPATTVSTLALTEPILASVLAYFLLGETIGGTVLVGGGLVAAGIVVVSLYGRSR